MDEIWKDVSKDDLEEAIVLLEKNESRGVVWSALIQVLIEKWKESPEKMVFMFKCPRCGLFIGGEMINNGQNIYTTAVECSCGWSRGPKDVSVLEILEHDEEN